jgi:hypothetical protein
VIAVPHVANGDLVFPNIQSYPHGHPNPNERNMGQVIAQLLRLFVGHVPDPESASRVAELATTTARWSAAHAVFDEVRTRLLAAIEIKDRLRAAQYSFEELCCKALYNATEPDDPFDPSSPFWVPGAAFELARAVGLPCEAVAAALLS